MDDMTDAAIELVRDAAPRVVEAAKGFLVAAEQLQTFAKAFESAAIELQGLTNPFCLATIKLRDAELEVFEAATHLRDVETSRRNEVIQAARASVDDVQGTETSCSTAFEKLNADLNCREAALKRLNDAEKSCGDATSEKRAAKDSYCAAEDKANEAEVNLRKAVGQIRAYKTLVSGRVDEPVLAYREIAILEEINQDKNSLYKRALEDWQLKQKDFAIKVSRRENKSIDLTTQIFNIIGWYAVFQGVVLTAVSQLSQSNQVGTLPMCKKIWFPITLTGFATLVTTGGILYKFRGLQELQVTILAEKQARIELEKRVSNLRREGPLNFRFREHTNNSLRNLKPRSFLINSIPVVLSLLIFTFLFIMSYFVILCNTWAK
ncbi:hypothetical protein KC19_8G099900 [Ceratodon purpureus]|uniref:Uncharacterized protein n=1 Tax=Ceratodon purpureus TaxID=3225 RepID=A0A8T0H1S5_CERPU|nr:hypothetical protein KC19_8G099900 [Ceratodon purpureus]